MAVRRPISVEVDLDRLVVLPSRHVSSGTRQAPAVVSFEQPTDRMLDEFAAAVRQHMDQWGLAGQGMVWRPVLMLRVGPRAGPQARKLARALENSGIEVQLPQTAERLDGGAGRATR